MKKLRIFVGEGCDVSGDDVIDEIVQFAKGKPITIVKDLKNVLYIVVEKVQVSGGVK